MHNQELAEKILHRVGGDSNVAEVVHCATRLRFTLNDKKKADVAALENLDGVITTVQSGGQFQVVVGNKVADIFREIENLISQGNGAGGAAKPADSKGPLISRLIDIISSIFTPLLGAMAASYLLCHQPRKPKSAGKKSAGVGHQNVLPGGVSYGQAGHPVNQPGDVRDAAGRRGGIYCPAYRQ